MQFPTVAVFSTQHRHCNNWPKPTDKAIRHCHSELSKTILTSPTVELSKVFTAIPGAIPTASSSFVFYGKMKMNTYIYGPKDDPYHSSPNWRKPYPEKEAAQIKDLVKEAAANKVDFVWAIHPGLDIKWTDEDRMNVLNKFGMMYDLGVRSFAVFFDDISGEGAKADKQADLLNFLQKEFIEKKEGVSPLIMCPTEYNRAWAGSDYLDVLGRTLDPAIHVMWTGNSVIHDITLEGQEWVNKRIQRPSYVWWNFPVSDYCRDHLLMGPSYGLDPNAAHAMSGFVANPMERAEASKVALYGVADYAWNMKAYNPESDFVEACRYVLPEAPEAFRTFCENNCDPGPNGHRYRRDESIRYAESAEAFLHDFRQHNYNADAADRMNRLFAEITAAPAAIETSRNKALIDEIKPWLMQFHLLGKAGQKGYPHCRNRTRRGSCRHLAIVSVAHLVARQHAHDRPDLQSESVSERRESRLTSPDPVRTGDTFRCRKQPAVCRPNRCCHPDE